MTIDIAQRLRQELEFGATGLRPHELQDAIDAIDHARQRVRELSDLLVTMPGRWPGSCWGCMEWGCFGAEDHLTPEELADPDIEPCRCDCHAWKTWADQVRAALEQYHTPHHTEN